MDIERDSGHFHGGPTASAFTSPSSRSSLGQTEFYSLSPPTPTPTTMSLPSSTFGSETDPSSTYATFDPDIHCDEFQTSGRIHINEYEDEETSRCDSLSRYREKKQHSTLFADPSPPLKLPPRLQHEYHFDSSNPRSSKSSPQSSFSRQIFKSDDFDPFLVAMKNVTVEGRRVKAESRASSFSSVWTTSPNEGPSIYMGSIEVLELDRDDDKKSIFGDPKEASKDVGFSASKRLGEPKGVKKARAIRLVKMGCCEESEPIIASTNGPKREIGVSIRMKKPKSENKQKSPKAPLWKATLLRVFCFRKARSGKDEKDKNVNKFVTLTVVRYRPRISLCFGVPRK